MQSAAGEDPETVVRRTKVTGEFLEPHTFITHLIETKMGDHHCEVRIILQSDDLPSSQQAEGDLNRNP